MIDFLARPLLIKTMNVPRHIEWAASLLLSRSLNRHGIELSSIMALPDDMDVETIDDKKLHQGSTSRSNDADYSRMNGTAAMEGGANTATASSIFDSFDPPAAVPKKTATSFSSTNTGTMNSSIFDTFDMPKKPVKKDLPKETTTDSGMMTSSIFDSFDAPPAPTQKPKTVTSSGTMNSSIFDSFDTCPKPKPKPTPPSQNNCGAMQSSIFDSFDTTQQQKVGRPVPLHTGAKKSENSSSTMSSRNKEEKIQDSNLPNLPVPPIWKEWRKNSVTVSVARRLIREIARIIGPILGHSQMTPYALFRRHIHPLVSYGASRILQDSCDGETILSLIFESLNKLCDTFKISKEPVIEQALLLLAFLHY